ncbi:hypothetical protein [Yinghuangia soli]|uniref:Tetratricopeptide repeat protein n=1 Tax=Yinghuangia soli TaxID=2908204 RepID=A0AA41TZR2_9ACTN|nr:hypothetical protein [Yinghuangia soli]MCF2527776.1 hypothetical protein [Yinghuangia soli]
MKIDDLQRRFDTYSGTLPGVVDALLDHGCLDLVMAAAEEREDWFCAVGAARELGAGSAFERAWAVIEPFAVTGWQPAVRAGADVLLRWGRVAEALELANPEQRAHVADDAWGDYLGVLVRAGRADEAICVVTSRVHDERTLRVLAELPDGTANADRVLDEAIRLLGADSGIARRGSVNTGILYARLLARRGRTETLRELADADAYGILPFYLTALEAQGRDDEAEAYLRARMSTAQRPWVYESQLMELLMRRHRFAEAIDAVDHTFESRSDHNLLQSALLLLAEHERHDEALALTENRSAEFKADNEECWLRSSRWWLMGETGRADAALAELEGLPPERVADREGTLAWLLARAGRTEEAIALLRRLPGITAVCDLALALIDQGRCAEALAALPATDARQDERPPQHG